MIKHFRVKHFRGFEHLNLTDLRPFTLVGGMNGVGKTSLLEAIFIHSGHANIELIQRTNLWRGLLRTGQNIDRQRLLHTLIGPSFHRYDLSKPILFESKDHARRTRRQTFKPVVSQTEQLVLSGEAGGGLQPLTTTETAVNLASIMHEDEKGKGERVRKIHEVWLTQRGEHFVVDIRPPLEPLPFPAHFLSENLPHSPSAAVERYTILRQQGQTQLLLQALRVMHPNLVRLEGLASAGTALLHVDLGNDLPLPIAVLGDGAVRLSDIVLAIVVAANGIVLVDELGYGMHYSVLDRVLTAIAEAAHAFKTQIIATTHSFEVIAAGHRVFSDRGEYDRFRYIRLESKNGQIQPIYFDHDSLQLAVEKGFEVR